MKLAAAFPRDHIPESTIEVYRTSLSSLDVGVIERVVDQAINNSKHFPTLAEMRQAYNQLLTRDQEIQYRPQVTMGRGVPMPDYVKKQLEELDGKMRKRSEELA